MSPKRKLIAGGIILVLALTYLGFAGVRSGWVYFVDVDTFVKTEGREGRRTRVHGVVGAERVDSRPADLVASFSLEGASRQVPVVYRGPVPDLFAPGRQVVVEGALDGTGVFRADVLMTKCASKYEGHGEDGPEKRASAAPAKEPRG